MARENRQATADKTSGGSPGSPVPKVDGGSNGSSQGPMTQSVATGTGDSANLGNTSSPGSTQSSSRDDSSAPMGSFDAEVATRSDHPSNEATTGDTDAGGGDSSQPPQTYRIMLIAVGAEDDHTTLGHAALGFAEPGDDLTEAMGWYPDQSGGLASIRDAIAPGEQNGGQIMDDTGNVDLALAGDPDMAIQMFEVDERTYATVKTYMGTYFLSNDYNLRTNNCVTAATRALRTGGLIQSDTGTGSYPTPSELRTTIRNGGVQ